MHENHLDGMSLLETNLKAGGREGEKRREGGRREEKLLTLKRVKSGCVQETV